MLLMYYIVRSTCSFSALEGKNNCRNDFMMNLHKICVAKRGYELVTNGSVVSFTIFLKLFVRVNDITDCS